MSQFLFESKHGKVWRNPVTGGHSCESRDVNALAGELAEALAAERAELAEYAKRCNRLELVLCECAALDIPERLQDAIEDAINGRGEA